MPLEIQPIPGQPGLFSKGLGGGIFDLPGAEATKLINRRKVLRKNWMRLRGQLGRGLGAPPAGISKALNNAALNAFNAFITWDDGIGTPKEILGAYESEVVDQEAIYDMYSNKVSQALESASKQPSFTTGIPRTQAGAAPAPPVAEAGVSPYPLPEEPSKWGTVEYVLASLAALSLVYIIMDFRKPQWFEDEVDIPEIKPPRGARSYDPDRPRGRARKKMQLEPEEEREDEEWLPEGAWESRPSRKAPSYPSAGTYSPQPVLDI